MNHTQARQLIQAAADGPISEANRRALDRHLAGCRQCQAYSANLNNLESRLSQGLQARWQDVQPRRFSLEQARERAPHKDSPGLRRLYHIVAVPAFQFGALVALAVGLILLIGSAASPHAATEPASQTPSPTKTLTEIAISGGTQEGLCRALANIDARVYREHDMRSEVVGALPHGQMASVAAYYLDEETNIVWLQIEYDSGLAWVTNTDALLKGDCSQMPTVGLSSTPMTPTVTATPSPLAIQPVVPPAATKPVCDLVAPSPQTMYADASLGAPVVGSWPSGETAPILAWAHNGLPPAWFLIRYDGVAGWVWAPWYNPASGSPCSDLPLTAYPTILPSPTAFPEACMVSPSDYAATDRNIYTGPASSYPVITVLNTGTYVLATGIFTQANYGTWVRIEVGGQIGWVDATYWMFSGNGCTPLTPVDFLPHPPTWTPTPAIPGPTPAPTDTPNPDSGPTEPLPLEFGWSLPADIGTTQSYFTTFPSQGNAAPTHHLVITFTGIPSGSSNDSRRVVDYTMTCSGGGSSSLKWGWASNPGTFRCGDHTRSDGLLWSASTVQFYIEARIGPTDTLTYTMTVSISAYPG